MEELLGVLVDMVSDIFMVVIVYIMEVFKWLDIGKLVFDEVVFFEGDERWNPVLVLIVMLDGMRVLVESVNDRIIEISFIINTFN